MHSYISRGMETVGALSVTPSHWPEQPKHQQVEEVKVTGVLTGEPVENLGAVVLSSVVETNQTDPQETSATKVDPSGDLR